MTATNQPNQIPAHPIKTTHVIKHPRYTDHPDGPLESVTFQDLNPYAYQRAKAQFFTASDAPTPPTSGTAQEKVIELREAVRVLATLIDMHVPKGRQRSLALTALEDVQMRANRGIFAPQDLITEAATAPISPPLVPEQMPTSGALPPLPRSVRSPIAGQPPAPASGSYSPPAGPSGVSSPSRRHLSPDERLQRDLQDDPSARALRDED